MANEEIEVDLEEKPQRVGFMRSSLSLSKLFGKKSEEEHSFNWVIVPDPNNRFMDYINPFFVFRENTVMAYLAGQSIADKYQDALMKSLFLLPIAFVAELIGAYGVTELLPNEVAYMTLLAALIRLLYFFRLNTDILAILYKKNEFILLIFSCVLGTVGLMDAFNYDGRCALAFDFFTIATYAACEDAANKYSKKGLSVRSYVVGTFVLYINLSVVLLLIYFGYVPDLVNRTLFITTFPTEFQRISPNVTASIESGFTVGTLNITLGLVQAILLYLFKSPYHLNRNEMAILQVSLYAKFADVDEIEIEQEEQMRTGARLRRLLTGETESEFETEGDERSDSHSSSRATQNKKVLEITGINPSQRLYRIAPVRSDFLVAGKPFEWDIDDSVGNRFFGERFSNFCYGALYLITPVQVFVALYAFAYPLIYLLVLFGMVPKQASWMCVVGFVLMFLYCNTLNYELLRRVLKTSGVRVMLILMILGNVGLAFGFRFDDRTAGMVFFSLAIFVFVALSDARIRAKDLTVYGIALFTYVYVTFTVLLVSFYVNLVVDIEDTTIDPSILSGRKATLELTTVGYSLYCLEIVVLFLARNYYSIFFRNGFSALEIRLRYFVQDMKDAVNSPYVDSGRVSTFVNPRKISALIPTTLPRPKGMRLPT